MFDNILLLAFIMLSILYLYFLIVDKKEAAKAERYRAREQQHAYYEGLRVGVGTWLKR